MLITNKSHKVYDEMVNSASPLTYTYKNLDIWDKVQNIKYILQKKLKDGGKWFFFEWTLHKA